MNAPLHLPYRYTRSLLTCLQRPNLQLLLALGRLLLQCILLRPWNAPHPNRNLCRHLIGRFALGLGPLYSAAPLPAPTRFNIHRARLPLEAPLPPPSYQPARAYSVYPSEARGLQVSAPVQEGERSASEAEFSRLSSFVRPSPKGPAALKPSDHTPALCPDAAAIAANLGGVVLQSTLHSEAWDAILLLWRS